MKSYSEFKKYLDNVYNNPRADRQNPTEKEKKNILNKMLYDNIRKRIVKGLK